MAKEKGRNVVLWTILECIPFLNMWMLAFFVGATNLKQENKLDKILDKLGAKE
ncbi:hypothetical protein AHAT_26000 [Agarivorans sp. Toyoura001]|nr:hypothetical protein AHAT_26000 [Agarivorans sp. Toyoura001]